MTTLTREINEVQVAQFNQLARVLWRGGKYGYLWAKSGDEKATHWLATESLDIVIQNTQKDIYFGVYPTNEKGTNHDRATIATIAALNCLFREYDLKDYDGTKAELQDHVMTLNPFPSVIVETAGGFHVYWLFKEPVMVDHSKIDTYKNALYGWAMLDSYADTNAKDLARVLRVPGTFNQKEKYTEDERLTRIIKFDLHTFYEGGKLLRQGLDHYTQHQRQTADIRASERGVIVPRKDINEKQLKAYVESILSDVHKVATAPAGQRTQLMFATAVRLGEVVASGALDYADARQDMLAACAQNGLVTEDGLANITKQIENGLNKGQSDGTPLDLRKFETYELTQRGLTVNDPPIETPDPRQNEAPADRNPVSSEMAFLGLILNNGKAYEDILTRYGIHAGHFANPRHQVIFSAIGLVALKGTPDLISVMELLRRKKQLDPNGGKDYLQDLAAADGNYSSLPAYVSAIIDASISRELTGLSSAIQAVNANPGLSADEKISKARALIEQVQTPSSAAVIETAEHALSEAFDIINMAMAGNYGTSTGWANLDAFGEFVPGEFIGLFSRPGMGKTATEINLMSNLVSAGHKVAMVSLEMSKAKIMFRWCAQAKHIPNNHFPNLRTNEEFKSYIQFMGTFPNELLLLNDKKGMTPAEIMNWMTRAHLDHGVNTFFFDHFGMVNYGVKNTHELRQAMGNLALEMRNFAVTYGCVIIAAGQLNRNCEQRADKRPLLSDVGDSDLISHHADRMWFLYRDSYYDMAQPGQENIMEILIRKNRDEGDRGTAYVNYNRLYQHIDGNVVMQSANVNNIEGMQAMPDIG